MIMFSDMEVVGLIPAFLDELDPRSAIEQIDQNYQHGGGWRDMDGTIFERESGEYVYCYPDDPPFQELSRAYFRDELLVFFDCQLLAVIQKDGSYRISRID